MILIVRPLNIEKKLFGTKKGGLISKVVVISSGLKSRTVYTVLSLGYSTMVMPNSQKRKMEAINNRPTTFYY